MTCRQAARRSRAVSPVRRRASPSENWGRAPLLSRAAELGLRLHRPAQRRRGRRAGVRARAADAVPAHGQGRRRPAARRRSPAAAGPEPAITDQAADDKVLAAIADGSTLVLQGLHRTWPPLVGFGARLADELGHPIQINAYITPPQNQGFAPHYDVHDVFVLQVSGRKHWTIHRPVVDDPLDNQPFDAFKAEIAARVTEPALIDTVLEPGDALYLPRGTVHSARGAGGDLDPPDRRRASADPLPAGAVPARRGAGRPGAARVAADGRRPRRPRRPGAAPRRHRRRSAGLARARARIADRREGRDQPHAAHPPRGDRPARAARRGRRARLRHPAAAARRAAAAARSWQRRRWSRSG